MVPWLVYVRQADVKTVRECTKYENTYPNSKLGSGSYLPWSAADLPKELLVDSELGLLFSQFGQQL